MIRKISDLIEVTSVWQRRSTVMIYLIGKIYLQLINVQRKDLDYKVKGANMFSTLQWNLKTNIRSTLNIQEVTYVVTIIVITCSHWTIWIRIMSRVSWNHMYLKWNIHLSKKFCSLWYKSNLSLGCELETWFNWNSNFYNQSKNSHHYWHL